LTICVRLVLLPSALLSVPLLAACSEGPDDDTTTSMFIAAAHDLGAPRAGAGAYPVDEPDAAWVAAELLVPGTGWDFPASSIPLFVWEDVAMAINVADDGSCPYSITHSDGASTTQSWESDCRSQDGYEWTGGGSRTTWSDPDADGVSWTLWTMDLEVEAGIDDPTFDRLGLHGLLWFGLGASDPLIRVAQVNMAIGLEGYWSRQDADTDREEVWRDLRLTGTWEEQETGPTDAHRFTGAALLGDLGGLAFDGPDVLEADHCAAEPSGTVTLQGSADATLTFDGDTTCDRCATLEVEGSAGQASCGS
jgi:hypothetical protein